MQENAERLIELIRPLLPDDESYGRLHADCHDLMEICALFLKIAGSGTAQTYSRDEIETFLIDLDIQIDHSLFHLKSLKNEVASALDKLAETGDDEMEREGADERRRLQLSLKAT